MATKKSETPPASQPEADPFATKAKRARAPMDRFRAARLCDAILCQLPPEDRALVVEFVRQPRQTSIPGVGNA